MAQALLFASLVGNLLYKDSNPLVCYSDTKNYLAAVDKTIEVILVEALDLALYTSVVAVV